MYIEPNIDLDSFIKDYHNGLSAKDIKEKYKLTPRQYRRLCEEKRLTRDWEYLKENPQFNKRGKALYYSKIGNKYVIRKVFGKHTVTYGSYRFKEIASYIVEELKKVRWDKSHLENIINNMENEEWYMNLYNEKIRSIRTTIEAEKMKERPDYDRLRRLRKELKMLLKESDIDEY